MAYEADEDKERDRNIQRLLTLLKDGTLQDGTTLTSDQCTLLLAYIDEQHENGFNTGWDECRIGYAEATGS